MEQHVYVYVFSAFPEIMMGVHFVVLLLWTAIPVLSLHDDEYVNMAET